MFANLPINNILDGDITWDMAADHIRYLLEDCPWFDCEGYLMIYDKEADLHGGHEDELVGDAIYYACSAHENASAYDAAELASKACGKEVLYIPPGLRRFGREDGFYHA